MLTKSWALGSSISCWASGPYAGWTTSLGSPTRSQSGRKLTDGARHVGICSPPAPRRLPETDNKPQEETGCFLIKQKWLVVTAQWTDMATLFPSFSKVLFTAYSKASLRWAALPVRVRHIYILFQFIMNMTQIFVRVATFDCIKMSQWLSMHNTRALKSKSSFVEFSHCSFDYLCLGFFHSDVIMSRKKYGNKTGNILNIWVSIL